MTKEETQSETALPTEQVDTAGESTENAATETAAEPTTDTTTEDKKDEVQTVGTKRDGSSEEGEPDSSSTPKRAKIAQPPVVSSLLVDVDEYTLDAPPTGDNADDDRIDTRSLILFGLHPLVKEEPLKKMCEKFGEIISIGVRSAFASRYGHVEFASVEQAKEAYRALNGATLLHKPILVQPTKSEAAAAPSS